MKNRRGYYSTSRVLAAARARSSEHGHRQRCVHVSVSQLASHRIGCDEKKNNANRRSEARRRRQLTKRQPRHVSAPHPLPHSRAFPGFMGPAPRSRRRATWRDPGRRVVGPTSGAVCGLGGKRPTCLVVSGGEASFRANSRHAGRGEMTGMPWPTRRRGKEAPPVRGGVAVKPDRDKEFCFSFFFSFCWFRRSDFVGWAPLDRILRVQWFYDR